MVYNLRHERPQMECQLNVARAEAYRRRPSVEADQQEVVETDGMVGLR